MSGVDLRIGVAAGDANIDRTIVVEVDEGTPQPR
jgi:hypothetical protein